MSRIRTVKPDLLRHEDLFDAELACGLPLRLAFIGLFTVADCEGRFIWKPRTLKLDVLPHDVVDFAAVLAALEAAGFIQRYMVDGVQYGRIKGWTGWQEIPLPPDWAARRMTVFKRDDYTCRYCGLRVESPHCDHVFPRSRGGSDDLENLATACPACNLSKSAKTPAEWKS